MKIGVVTSSRADFGLLIRTIKLIQSNAYFESTVFACGSHLSPEFGLTKNEIELEGIKNVVYIETMMSSSSKLGIAKSTGLAVLGFADAFSHHELDCVLLLGDRFEILAAAQAAMFLDISIAHIHGGEVTEGAFDDAIRHSITKMANIHFPATIEFSRRIKQLGELDSSIFIVGAPGIDNIVNEMRVSHESLDMGFAEGLPLALVTYHPVTKGKEDENNIGPLVAAIKKNSQLNYLITYPNADGDGAQIIRDWEILRGNPNVKIVKSLGSKNYLAAMQMASLVIGNSSSGIIEAPSFRVPTINIGSRQKGRPRCISIVDVRMKESEISEAISNCLSDHFVSKLDNCINPYGNGSAAENIVNILSKLKLEDFKYKSFVDRSFDE